MLHQVAEGGRRGEKGKERGGGEGVREGGREEGCEGEKRKVGGEEGRRMKARGVKLGLLNRCPYSNHL